MVSVGKLKSLLEKIPDEAMCWAYEGEDIGIGFELNEKHWWWIRATDSEKEDEYIEGFKS